MSEVAVRIEPLTRADVAAAVELAVWVLRVKPGDRGEQFAADIIGERRQLAEGGMLISSSALADRARRIFACLKATTTIANRRI